MSDLHASFMSEETALCKEDADWNWWLLQSPEFRGAAIRRIKEGNGALTNPRRYRTSFGALVSALDNIQVENDGYQHAYNFVTQYGLQKARVFFIGNGGSAAIASHMACDWQKNANFATFGPPDSSLMSCYGNDYGFDHVYSEVIERHGQLGDVLFAISSSGMSEDILRACDAAKDRRMNVITLSGFGEGNFLRTKGQVNFYVPSTQYGTVEIAHLAIIHSILDEVIANQRG